ncbi:MULTISPECIES: terminase gpA endonuclease subunit [unclassified Xanthomonas]|uniref:terminase gpA endonuclease subunit n=1 Tax=unclassified Xanthomonas TaxID=2643310 RepID=UPI002A80CF64|nr:MULTISPECIES: terminase gpA endonuclease subunit [unclassified Xanthomonas]MDY4296817.1 terminase gpA endonuclease subunit [Xanthomonas sp. LF02-5]MDY4358424.1 terminase gpA endonuclease subunit [Xanthomonas sp. LF04-12]
MLELIAHDVELADPQTVVCDAWERAWQLPPLQTVSEWADAHRIIAKGAGAEPGPWRTARNPILREIMDALSDHSPVREVDFMKSAQIGATEIGINWTGYIIDRGADSMIVAQPVKDLARSWATSKFDPAVAEMPDLLSKLDTDNTLEKRYPGGTLWVIWTNSAKQLRQRTARYIFADEVDEYPRDVGGQGPADQQLAARAMSYGDRGKIYRACTPTIEGGSAIEAGHAEGDQRVYVVCCPHCGGEQVLEEERLQPDGTFACAVSGCVIEEHHKDTLFAERGFGGSAYWRPTNPKASPYHRSYHAWAAYAPLGLGLSWKDLAEAKAEAERDPSKLQGYHNLILGRPYAGERQEQDDEEVAKLAEPGVHRGIVPAGGLVLTVGVDLQHDRAELQLIATGRAQRRWVVDYAVIDIDPTILDTYSALDEYLLGTWKTRGGIDMAITAVAVDGGNWTEVVAQFVKRLVGQSGQARVVQTPHGYIKQTVYLIRGRNERKTERAVYRPSKTEVNAREKTIARSVGVWGVGTSVLKHMVYGWLSAALVAKQRAEADGEAEVIDARMLRFPGGRGDEVADPLNPDPGALPAGYYKGLTVEYYDKESGYWVKPKGARNEPLDTAVYAVWASLAPAVKADVIRESQWEALEQQYHPLTAGLFDAPTHGDADSREEEAQEPEAAVPQPAAIGPYVPRYRRGVRSPGVR